jgi:hypothetical protein
MNATPHTALGYTSLKLIEVDDPVEEETVTEKA